MSTKKYIGLSAFVFISFSLYGKAMVYLGFPIFKELFDFIAPFLVGYMTCPYLAHQHAHSPPKVNI